MTSYIVRVYRRDPNSADELVGVVEMPENGLETAFKNFAQLRAILSSGGIANRPRTGDAKREQQRKTS